MIFLLCLALALSTPMSSTLLKNMSSLADSYHQKCTQTISTSLKNKAALDSLLCGEKITNPNLQKNLTQTSLIHLFVISGSHLLLIDGILSKLSIPFLLRFLVLSFYSLLAAWQPPVVRALLGLVFRESTRQKGCYFTGDLSVLATGLLTLFLFPEWRSSLSLQLSWVASLALCGPSLLRLRSVFYKLLLVQLLVFVFLAPLLWGFGSLHPLGLFNIFLAPVIALILLPLGTLLLVIPQLALLFDFILEGFSQVLLWFSDPIVLPQSHSLPREVLWLWIAFLHLSFYVLRLHIHQGKDSSR